MRSLVLNNLVQFCFTIGSGCQQNDPDLVTVETNGDTENVNIRYQCITAMKGFEGKSLEVGHYICNADQ